MIELQELTDTEYADRVAFTFGLPAGTTDDDYQAYLRRRIHIGDIDLDYDEWLATVEEINELNGRYAKEVEPYYANPNASHDEKVEALHRKLITEITRLEGWLRY